jgi:hypothetical protein
VKESGTAKESINNPALPIAHFLTSSPLGWAEKRKSWLDQRGNGFWGPIEPAHQRYKKLIPNQQVFWGILTGSLIFIASPERSW